MDLILIYFVTLVKLNKKKEKKKRKEKKKISLFFYIIRGFFIRPMII